VPPLYSRRRVERAWESGRERAEHRSRGGREENNHQKGIKLHVKTHHHYNRTRERMRNISSAEIDFIQKGVERNIRGDGRTRTDYRNIGIELGLLQQANGSCRLKLSDTDILVTVRAQVGQIIPETTEETDLSDNEDCGRVVCNVEWYSSAGDPMIPLTHRD
jgi:hypothetical protein